MARRYVISSDNLLARVRAWFGLDQTALALYTGASLELIRSVESGRRRLTLALTAPLLPLLRYLPPAEAAVPPATEAAAQAGPPLGLPAPEREELEFRRRVCRQRAAKATQQLAALEARAQVATHWAEALPTLREAAAALPPDPDNPGHLTWLSRWLTHRAQPLPAEAATRWHLLRAQLAALAAEEAALTASLGTL